MLQLRSRIARAQLLEARLHERGRLRIVAGPPPHPHQVGELRRGKIPAAASAGQPERKTLLTRAARGSARTAAVSGRTPRHERRIGRLPTSMPGPSLASVVKGSTPDEGARGRTVRHVIGERARAHRAARQLQGLAARGGGGRVENQVEILRRYRLERRGLDRAERGEARGQLARARKRAIGDHHAARHRLEERARTPRTAPPAPRIRIALPRRSLADSPRGPQPARAVGVVSLDAPRARRQEVRGLGDLGARACAYRPSEGVHLERA
jgi:hypothetical protein